MWAPRRSRAAIASHSNFIRKFDLIRWTSWQKLPTSFSEFKSSPSDCSRMGWNSLEGIQSKEGIIHGKSWFTIGEINAVQGSATGLVWRVGGNSKKFQSSTLCNESVLNLGYCFLVLGSNDWRHRHSKKLVQQIRFSDPGRKASLP